MKSEPIKLQDNLNLYSGDVITINNSKPLLVEVENSENQTIKLRNVKDDKYLSKKFFSIDFSTGFESALTLTVKQNNNDKISLQTDDNKYLKSDSKNFSLSSKERLLTTTKQQDIENIADYKETIKETKLHKEEVKKINDEKSLTIRDFHDNKSGNDSKHTFKITESTQKEHNLTLSTDFTFGASVSFKLDCLSIGGIEIGGQFEKKHGTSNSITKTDNTTTEKSLEVTCSPWKKMRVVSEIKKTKLLIPYAANVKREIGERSYEYSIDGEYFYEESLCHNSFNEEIAARNILLVGCTGSGKSTLAKVLSGDDSFEEGSGSVSKTKFFKKSKEFQWKENDYYVIDNIGFGDTEVTKISEREELIRIGEAINSAYQGLSQVLFVFSGRLSDKEKEGFGKLAALKITNSYITLVRSKFVNFGNKEACKRDKEALAEESPEISKLLNNCRGILHIDNDDDDEYLREDSREKVLNYLHNNCTDNPFKPKEWKDISSLIDNYLEKKAKLENEKDQADTVQKKAIDQQIDILKENTAEKVKEKIQGEEISEVFQLAQIVQKEK